MFKRLLNAIGLMLISDENKRKILQHGFMLRACVDVYDWCGSQFPQAAEAAEYVRTRALGCENRLGYSEKIMSPYDCCCGISDWREAMRRKYMRSEVDFDGKTFTAPERDSVN